MLCGEKDLDTNVAADRMWFHLLFKEAALYLNVRDLDLDFFSLGVWTS
jgi:hypothetical protein